MAEASLSGRVPLKVLLVEDHPDDRELILLELRRSGFDAESALVWTRQQTEEQLREHEWQLVLSDHALPGFSSAEVLELLQQEQPGTPCIIISGAIGEDAAVRLLQAGAVDYLNKNSLDRLGPAVNRALQIADARRARQEAEEALLESERRLRELNENLEQRVQERSAEVVMQSKLLETAVNSMRDAFYLFDDGGRLVRWNSTMRSVSGLSDERLEGMPLSQLIIREDVETLEQWLSTIQAEGRATCELHFASSRDVPFEFTGTLLDNGTGHQRGICGIAHNVAARKQTEAQLKEAIRTVIEDASWFAQSVLDKMTRVTGANPLPEHDVDLTDRESEVLECIASGRNNEQIATELGLSYATVRNYVARLYGKLGVHSRAEAVIWARERGFGQGESIMLT